MRIPETGPGVYLVPLTADALTADTDANIPVPEACPISREAVELA
jgi:hypothetical protein